MIKPLTSEDVGAVGPFSLGDSDLEEGDFICCDASADRFAT